MGFWCYAALTSILYRCVVIDIRNNIMMIITIKIIFIIIYFHFSLSMILDGDVFLSELIMIVITGFAS